MKIERNRSSSDICCEASLVEVNFVKGVSNVYVCFFSESKGIGEAYLYNYLYIQLSHLISANALPPPTIPIKITATITGLHMRLTK